MTGQRTRGQGTTPEYPQAWRRPSPEGFGWPAGMEEYRDLAGPGLVEELPQDSAVYVSIDIDALDMSLVPGCVSAEPDGLSYRELRDTLVALSEHTNVVGLDLVEVNPLLDVGTGVKSYLAAHTIVEFLGHICAQPRWVARRAARAEQRRSSSGD